MTGEYLNSDDLKCRVYACKLLPCLKRPLNKDITTKLVHLMWNDSSKYMRKVAAQTLGRTGRGQYVHDEIHQRLQSTNVKDRIEALRKINFLGVMTVKLLPEFLKCFKDEFNAVKEMACKSAQKLAYTDEKIITQLLDLAQFDESPKIKTCAIQSNRHLRSYFRLVAHGFLILLSAGPCLQPARRHKKVLGVGRLL
jgi:hypothetical protein